MAGKSSLNTLVTFYLELSHLGPTLKLIGVPCLTMVKAGKE